MIFVRTIIMTAILIVVWRHAHWSVALSLTLISAYCELMFYTVSVQRTSIRRMFRGGGSH